MMVRVRNFLKVLCLHLSESNFNVPIWRRYFTGNSQKPASNKYTSLQCPCHKWSCLRFCFAEAQVIVYSIPTTLNPLSWHLACLIHSIYCMWISICCYECLFPRYFRRWRRTGIALILLMAVSQVSKLYYFIEKTQKAFVKWMNAWRNAYTCLILCSKVFIHITKIQCRVGNLI